MFSTFDRNYMHRILYIRCKHLHVLTENICMEYGVWNPGYSLTFGCSWWIWWGWGVREQWRGGGKIPSTWSDSGWGGHCLRKEQGSLKHRANIVLLLLFWSTYFIYVLLFITTVEPLTNDHPHQRPSLSYDHISCDGQWFLFVYESLTSDHPSYTTTQMWFWGWSYKRGSTVHPLFLID